MRHRFGLTAKLVLVKTMETLLTRLTVAIRLGRVLVFCSGGDFNASKHRTMSAVTATTAQMVRLFFIL